MELPKAPKLRILFVCSGNIDRSPTAAAMYKGWPGIKTRDAGTYDDAPHPIEKRDLRWADLVLVMEEKHRDFIAVKWPDWMAKRKNDLHVLEIPDVFEANSEQLKEAIGTKATSAFLDAFIDKWSARMHSRGLSQTLPMLDLLDKGPASEEIVLALVKGRNIDAKRRQLEWLIRNGLVASSPKTAKQTDLEITDAGKLIVQTILAIDKGLNALEL